MGYDRNKKNNGKTNYLFAWKSKLFFYLIKMTIKKFENEQLSFNKKKLTNIIYYMALFEKISASEEILNEHKIKKFILNKNYYQILVSTGKFPGSHPLSLNLGNIKNLKDKDFLISRKADGIRLIISIEFRHVFIVNCKMKVYRMSLSHIKFIIRRQKNKMEKIKIDYLLPHIMIDGKMVID